jgi:hypothetical protein
MELTATSVLRRLLGGWQAKTTCAIYQALEPRLIKKGTRRWGAGVWSAAAAPWKKLLNPWIVAWQDYNLQSTRR